VWVEKEEGENEKEDWSKAEDEETV